LQSHIGLSWGKGFEGQLGDGRAKDSLTPVRVIVPTANGGTIPLNKVAAITAGSQHTCALLENHQVFCWGSNALDQLGTAEKKNAAYPVFSGLADVTAVSAGGWHTCAMLSSGETKCVGSIQAPQVLE
jgi:alpha-tubulin suppressor-like RCC1 family protein